MREVSGSNQFCEYVGAKMPAMTKICRQGCRLIDSGDGEGPKPEPDFQKWEEYFFFNYIFKYVVNRGGDMFCLFFFHDRNSKSGIHYFVIN